MELRRAGVELSSGVVLKDPGQQQQTGLPYGLIWTPFNAVDDINLTSQPPPKCATCQGLYSRLCQVDRVTMLWKCVLCGLLNDARHIPTIPRDNEGNTARMTSDVDVAEYILPSEGNSNVDSRLIFIIDEHIGIDEIEMAKIAEIATSAAIERGYEVALMLFGEATSLVDFGHARENSDEESPVQIILDVLAPEEVAQMSVSEKDSYFSADVDLVSDSVWSALGSKQEAREETTAKERIRNRRKRRQKRERRLDIALEIALELLPKDLSDYSTLRVATLLSGRPSLGVEGLDDEEEFEMALTSTMRKIGKQAASMRTVLDFFCFAAIHGFAASALLAAAVASGGGIVLSAMHGLSSHEHVSSVFRFISVRAFATGGRIEARSSNELELQHVIGPAVEGGAYSFEVPSVEREIGFALFYEVVRCVESCFIQLVSERRDVGSEFVTVRCITFKVGNSTLEDVYTRSIRPVVAATMLAKRSLLKSFGASALTRKNAAESIVDAAAISLIDGSIGSTAAAKAIVRCLYDLRRGVLLGRQLHKDDAICLRALLCNAEPSLAAKLITPRLLKLKKSSTNHERKLSSGDAEHVLAGVGIEAHEVAGDWTCLKADSLLMMDAGTEIFIWQGSQVSWSGNIDIAEYCRRALVPAATKRVPPAQVWSFREGESMSRMMLCRLSPDSAGQGALGPEQAFEAYFRSLE
eukprot:CAMPEP_0113963018 /NCGR_PEP_ID=MMETSP0011_2-20120614/6265_1 /TAXON_ID=101924 /ORGANISM="Rhodosorus marinus" /LENGTH=695 /DNA_ID=CAMNT_0000974991 /DNA_START=1499 /DNA_END=3586 /DNA_ORIENTATION=- /assembly_acc=CAM_ASM_000156